MEVLRFLKRYKIGAAAGIAYGVVAFAAVYVLQICQNSDGLCIAFSPLYFHESLIVLLNQSLATPVFLLILNLTIFIFEGAFMEMVVRKTNK